MGGGGGHPDPEISGGGGLKKHSNRYWPGFLIPWGVFWIPKAQDSGFRTTKFPRFRNLLYVSGKLPTYPSPKPTLTLTCHLGQIWA